MRSQNSWPINGDGGKEKSEAIMRWDKYDDMDTIYAIGAIGEGQRSGPRYYLEKINDNSDDWLLIVRKNGKSEDTPVGSNLEGKQLAENIENET